MQSNPGSRKIYHITSINNLESIIRLGGLACYHELHTGNTDYTDIAHESIQSRRARCIVRGCRGGTLHDYVPFHFGPRPPMLYSIWRGNVAQYKEGQTPIVHLVSSVQSVCDAELPWIFTDGHAIMSPSNYYETLADLEDKVDWDLMIQSMWNDVLNDMDRSRRRQAEFLVHRSFPWNLITTIGTINRSVADQVENLLRSCKHRPPVIVQRQWYYG